MTINESRDFKERNLERGNRMMEGCKWGWRLKGPMAVH